MIALMMAGWPPAETDPVVGESQKEHKMYVVFARYSHELSSSIISRHTVLDRAVSKADKWTSDHQCDGGVLLAHVYRSIDYCKCEEIGECIDGKTVDGKHYHLVDFFDTHRITPISGGIGYERDVSQAAAILGRKGGSVRSPAKSAAAIARNAKRKAEGKPEGGRPKKAR